MQKVAYCLFVFVKKKKLLGHIFQKKKKSDRLALISCANQIKKGYQLFHHASFPFSPFAGSFSKVTH